MLRVEATDLLRRHCKPTTTGQLLYICPNASCRKLKFYVDPVKRVAFCHRCNLSAVLVGDNRPLIARLEKRQGKEVLSADEEDQVELPPFVPLSKKARAFLWGRGITSETARDFAIKLGSYDAEQFAQRILFPVFGGTSWLGVVGRTFLPGDRRPKYINSVHLKGRHRCYRTFTAGRVDWLAIVEGPIDALILHQLGIPAVALLGHALDGEEQLSEILSYVTRGVLVAQDAEAWTASIKIAAQFSPYVEAHSCLFTRGDPADGGTQEVSDRFYSLAS